VARKQHGRISNNSNISGTQIVHFSGSSHSVLTARKLRKWRQHTLWSQLPKLISDTKAISIQQMTMQAKIKTVNRQHIRG